MNSAFNPVAALFVAASMLLCAPALAQEPPEGIDVTVIAEYQSRVPGIEKVRLARVLMQPGASFDNVVIRNEEYCEIKRGTLTHVNHTTEITDVFTPGARFAPPKGDYHTVTNTGDDVVEMWVYQLIEEGAEPDGM